MKKSIKKFKENKLKKSHLIKGGEFKGWNYNGSGECWFCGKDDDDGKS